MGHIEGRVIHWLHDVNPGFTPDYGNIVQDTAGCFWVFTREPERCLAYRSARPNDIRAWATETVCLAVPGRHAPDAAALDAGKLYVASVLTTEGKLYGNLYDGAEWIDEAVLIADGMTTVAGDDRRLALEFDPTQKRLHLVYVDGQSRLRYRSLDWPYSRDNWQPRLGEPGIQLAADVFTCALSVDKSVTPYDLLITFGREKHIGADGRERTGELYVRRFSGGEWMGQALLVSQPDTRHNWYPNVNQDATDGLCVLYSRSADEQHLGTPLAIMVSICDISDGSRMP